MRGTTSLLTYCHYRPEISTHVPHAGHDRPRAVFTRRRSIFQLTCPMRGTTEFADETLRAVPISTHVPHAGHDIQLIAATLLRRISTHVPHAGHD